MKKTKFSIHLLIIFSFVILFSSCAAINHMVSKMFPSKASVCPTNDSKFFFRQNGTRPTKQYRRNHRN